jgi:hypothetical protein
MVQLLVYIPAQQHSGDDSSMMPSPRISPTTSFGVGHGGRGLGRHSSHTGGRGGSSGHGRGGHIPGGGFSPSGGGSGGFPPSGGGYPYRGGGGSHSGGGSSGGGTPFGGGFHHNRGGGFPPGGGGPPGGGPPGGGFPHGMPGPGMAIPYTPPTIRVKFDIDKIPSLTTPSKFASWEVKVRTYCVVTGLIEPLDLAIPPYALRSHAGLQVYLQKSSLFFWALQEKVKFVEGRAILDRHVPTMNGAQAFHELRLHCTQSPSAVLNRQEIYRDLISTRIKSSYTGSLEDCITTWQVRVDRYNRDSVDGRDVISGTAIRTHLEYMVMDVPGLAEIISREADNFVYTGRRLTDDQYLSLLKNQAQRMDIARGTRSRSREGVDRHLYEAVIHDSEPEPEDALAIFEARRRRPFRPRMDKATWDSLTQEGQTVWDTLSSSDKAIILGYRSKRPDSSSTREAGVHSLLDDDLVGADVPLDDDDLSAASEFGSLQIHHAQSADPFAVHRLPLIHDSSP